MSNKSEKLIYSLVTVCVLLLSVGLELGGSFVPFWAAPLNETSVEGAGNVSYSLWTKRECWDVVCRTTLLRVKWTTEECINIDGVDSCTTTTGYKSKPKRECFDYFSCNTTWHFNEAPDSIPSLLFMGKAFETPGIVCGFIAIILYVVKILMLVKCTDTKRLHLRAAYLTFSAIAGAAAEIGVIIFCVMLETDRYVLGWGPALPGVGGFLQLSVACGGYLSWRNGPGDDYFDEDDEAFMEEEKVELKRPVRQAPQPPAPKTAPKTAPPPPPKPDHLLRSISVPVAKSGSQM